MLQRARQEINALEDTSGDDGGSPRHRQRDMGPMGLAQGAGVAAPPAPAYGPRHRVQHMDPVPGTAGRAAGAYQGGHSCRRGLPKMSSVLSSGLSLETMRMSLRKHGSEGKCLSVYL